MAVFEFDAYDPEYRHLPQQNGGGTFLISADPEGPTVGPPYEPEIYSGPDYTLPEPVELPAFEAPKNLTAVLLGLAALSALSLKYARKR